MALINCPECGNKVSDLAEICLNCSFPLNNRNVEVQNKEGFFLQSMNFGCQLVVYAIIGLILAIIATYLLSSCSTCL